jgi:hypothetical protein
MKELKKVQDKRDEMIEGALGTGGAVAVANGTKIYRTVAGVTQKTTSTVSQVSKNTKGFQNFFAKAFKSAETLTGFGWVAKFAKTPVVKGAWSVLGGFAAVGICATDISNMVNTFGGDKFPTLGKFGK